MYVVFFLHLLCAAVYGLKKIPYVQIFGGLSLIYIIQIMSCQILEEGTAGIP